MFYLGASTDLVGGGASAVFTAHKAGGASIGALITGLTATPSGTLTVPNVNPVANADSVTRGAGASLKIPIATLLANDTDANGETISFTGLPSTTSGQGATLSADATHVFYQPGSAGNGDTFSYPISDGNGGMATGTVTVHELAAAGQSSGSISVSGGSATVKMFGIPGLSYDVQRSMNLSVWTAVAGSPMIAAPDGSISLADTFSAPAPSSAYYRIIYHP